MIQNLVEYINTNELFSLASRKIEKGFSRFAFRVDEKCYLSNAA